MRFFLDLRLAYRSLVQHGRRTLLLGLAIAAVMSLWVLLMGLAAGVRETMLHTSTTLVSGHLNVAGLYKVRSGQSVPLLANTREVLAVVKRAVPALSFAVVRGRGSAKLVSDTGSEHVSLNGIDLASEPDFRRTVRVLQGNLDDLAGPGGILLFESQVEKLGVRVGDSVTLIAPTGSGATNTLDVRVVAIARDLGLLSRFNSFVSNDSLRSLYQYKPGTAGVIQLQLRPEALPRLQAIARHLRSELSASGYRLMLPVAQPFWTKLETVKREDWTGQKLDVTTWQDEMSFLSWTLSALDALSALLLGALLAIVVVGVMNTMWIAIRERTREIGALRAIGMQRGQVLRTLLLESAMLGALGATVGASFGALTAIALNAAHIAVPLSAQLILMSDKVVFAVHAGAIWHAVLVMTLVAAIAAAWPALRAARLEPIEAMQHFG